MVAMTSSIAVALSAELLSSSCRLAERQLGGIESTAMPSSITEDHLAVVADKVAG